MQMCLWQFVVLKGSFRLPPTPALWCSHWHMQGVLIPLLQSVGKFLMMLMHRNALQWSLCLAAACRPSHTLTLDSISNFEFNNNNTNNNNNTHGGPYHGLKNIIDIIDIIDIIGTIFISITIKIICFRFMLAFRFH